MVLSCSPRLLNLPPASRKRIAEDLGVVGVLPPLDGGSRRTAQGKGGYRVGELHPLVGDVALEVRHLILGARELIVGQDEDDVGLLGGVPHFSATSGRKYSCR